MAHTQVKKKKINKKQSIEIVSEKAQTLDFLQKEFK